MRWRVADGLVAYQDAVAEMEREAALIAEGKADELVWLVEHPPVITLGRRGDVRHVLQRRAPVLRVSGADVPLPYAANLEKLALPQPEWVVDAAKRVCYR